MDARRRRRCSAARPVAQAPEHHLPPHQPATHPLPTPPTAEQYIQDEVSGVDERRRGVAAALIIFAVLTLVPLAPDVMEMTSVGSPANFI